jgi:hypothetical protein
LRIFPSDLFDVVSRPVCCFAQCITQRTYAFHEQVRTKRKAARSGAALQAHIPL